MIAAAQDRTERSSDVRIRWLHQMVVLLTVLSLLLVAAPLAADEGDDDSGAGPSEGEIAEPDAQGEDEDEEEEEDEEHPARGLPFEGLGGVSWAPEFHPSYTIKFGRDQDVTSWNHDFDLAYALSPRLRVRADASIGIRTNDVLNRENRRENWSASLDMKVSPVVSTGVRFTRSIQSDVRNEGKSNESRSFRERDSVDLSTSFKRKYLETLDVSLSASAGLENNHYSDIKSTGSKQSVGAGLSFDPLPTLQTSFNYSGTHSLLDSDQAGVESTDESSSHNLSGHFDYQWNDHSVSADVRRSSAISEYPKDQQTETRDQEGESASVSANIVLMEGLDTRFSADYTRNKSFYDLEATKDIDIKSRSVKGDVSYRLGDTSFSANLKSETKRNEYFDFQTGEVYTNSIYSSLARDFGERVDVELRGRMSLLSLHYDDIAANDQDRDLFDREATIKVNYDPRSDLSTGLVLKVREDRLIYIRVSRTGDNKTTQTYSIQPSIRKTFSRRVSVRQRYDLSADYTLYTYDKDANFLIRNFAVTTGLDWSPWRALKLGLAHTYRSQDEGSYVEDEVGVERYSKNSEREEHRVTITLRYPIFGVIDFEVEQHYSVQERWRFEGGERTLASERFDTNITGRASADYTLESGARLDFSIGRTHRDASNILDRQREIWDVRINVSRTF